MADTVGDVVVVAITQYGQVFGHAFEIAKSKLNELGYISDELKICAIILYGSRVYGTANSDSDYDVLVVVDSDKLIKPLDTTIDIHHTVPEHSAEQIEVTIVSSNTFKSNLANAELREVESIYTPERYVWTDPTCQTDQTGQTGQAWLTELKAEFVRLIENPETRADVLKKLRSTFSKYSSNSEVKARKKVKNTPFVKPGCICSDVCKCKLIGLKSIFHSIRIMMFGIQIGTLNEITNFEEAAQCWDDLNREYVPNIDQLTDADIAAIHKKYVRTPTAEGEPHLESRFKIVLPK